MKHAAWTIGGWLGLIRRSLTRRSKLRTAERPPHASDILLAMALVMLLVVLFARLLTQLFGQG